MILDMAQGDVGNGQSPKNELLKTSHPGAVLGSDILLDQSLLLIEIMGAHADHGDYAQDNDEHHDQTRLTKAQIFVGFEGPDHLAEGPSLP